MAFAVISRSLTKESLTIHVPTETERRSGALPQTILTKEGCGVSADGVIWW